MGGLVWEEFGGGGTWETETRTVMAADLARFSELSGDANPLHLDDGYARGLGYEGRIAQGALGVAIATGLVNRRGLTAGTLIALLGMSWRFERPLYPGTVVRVRLEVASRRAASKPDRGVVVLAALLEGVDGEVFHRGELTLLVRRGAPAGGVGVGPT